MTLAPNPAETNPRDGWVVRARTEREAFGLLYDAYYPSVFRYCHRRLYERTTAEDATSEVFLSVAANMPRFAGTTEEDFRRWVFRIATNVINAHVRQTKRRRVLLESAAREGVLSGNGDSVSGRADVEDDRPEWPIVHRAILGLKPRDQAIVVLRFFERMSHEQIAGVLGERPATVRVALGRALEKLRHHFVDEMSR